MACRNDGLRRPEPMNSIGWIVTHMAWHECRWHEGQAIEATGAPLAHLADGTMAQLRVWATEFDAIGEGSTWPAIAFVDWLAADQAAAALSVAPVK